MASVSMSGWRNRRGEPQAKQRPTCSGTSRRQSRQKPGNRPLACCGIAPRRDNASRRVALPTAPGDGITRFHDRARRDRVFRGKCKEQRLFASQMIEHPEQELRLVGGRADGFRTNSGQRQEAAKPPGLRRKEGERRDGEPYRCCPLILRDRKSVG